MAIWATNGQKAVDMLLATNDGTIGIGTARNMDVPVSIKIFNAEPELLPNDLGTIDKINECDLKITSGKIVVAGCSEYFRDAKRLKLDNGIYRVRIYYGNLEKLSEDGLDGEDFYEIHLWPTVSEYETKIILNRLASH